MHVNVLRWFLIVPGWGILAHPAVLVRGGGQLGSKEKGGGGVELGGAVCLGGGSLFPWFPRVTSPHVKHMK